MSITECPHCHRRVAPSDSGECPSCGQNVSNEPTDANRMRLLVLRGNKPLPNVCFNCAQPARKTIKIQVSNVDAGVSLGRGFFEFLPFGRLFSAFEAAKRDIFVRVKLPICDACRKKRIKPEIQSYDLESREIRLVVNEAFRDLALGG